MIKIFLVFFVLGFSHFSWGDDHIPHSETHNVIRGDVRYFKALGDFRLMSEIQVSNAFEGEPQHHWDLGGYYRWLSFSKVGLIHRYQKNVRHEDDWIVKNGQWIWNEDANDYESVIIPHLDFRTLLSDSLRGDLVFRYMYNARNTQESLLIRPGLNYFWFRGGRMFANVYLQFEQVIPLNFGNGSVSERWVYLGFLYHLNSNNKLGISAETGQWVWTDSEDFKARYPNEDYDAEEKANTLGLIYIFTH